MMVPLTSLILPFLLSYFSVRPVHASPYRRAAALPPSQDPWYTPPEGYEDAAPGEILRIRPAKDSLIAALGKNASAIYNILYGTSDSFDKPSWAVTTLLVPPEPLHNNGTSLLSYQIPYNTVNLDYSPSYTLDAQFASAFSDIIPSLSRGWYVNIPTLKALTPPSPSLWKKHTQHSTASALLLLREMALEVTPARPYGDTPAEHCQASSQPRLHHTTRPKSTSLASQSGACWQTLPTPS